MSHPEIIVSFIALLCLMTVGGRTQIAQIDIVNPAKFERINEYVIVQLQAEAGVLGGHCMLIDTEQRDTIFAQIFNRKIDEQRSIENFYLIAPVSLGPEAARRFTVRSVKETQSVPDSDLRLFGSGLELTVENGYYMADLRRDEDQEGQKCQSGQLNKLTLKKHDHLLLQRTSNRMHWAPNFRRSGEEHYRTIAHWDPPDSTALEAGPYLIRLFRSGKAPGYPEIYLNAVYYFLAGVPYFRFYSDIQIGQDVNLSLLRNDEMTMDSLFTNVAFCRSDGRIGDYPFSLREQVLHKYPVSGTDPWLCFYHDDRRYAFGTIRLFYDNRNDQGLDSPTFLPHTKISDGAGGGKYWNRRLIHEHDTFIPAGSRYREENAYLVFDAGGVHKFETIIYWEERLRLPFRVQVFYDDNDQDH